MNKYLFTIALLVAVHFFSIATCTGNDFPNDDYMWLEFGDMFKEPDGSMSQLIYICYGRFLERKKNIASFDVLDVFYTLSEKYMKGREIYYICNIEKKNNRPCIKVNSKKTNWFKVVAEGNIKDSNVVHAYTAETSFFLFGESGLSYAVRDHLAAEDYFMDRPDIRIYREQVKDMLTYNRMKKFPIRGRVFWGDKSLKNVEVEIIDNGNRKFVKTNKKGGFVYVAGEKDTNGGLQRNEHGQDLIIATIKKRNIIYKTCYSVLFDARGAVAVKGGHNIVLGTIIFCVTFAVVMPIVIIFRKRWYEDL